MSNIPLSPSSRQSLFKIIADTPFLSSPVVLVSLPAKLEALGLSTVGDVASAPARRLASGLASVEARIEGSRKSETLRSLHEDLPARLASLLQKKAASVRKGTAISAGSLNKLL